MDLEMADRDAEVTGKDVEATMNDERLGAVAAAMNSEVHVLMDERTRFAVVVMNNEISVLMDEGGMPVEDAKVMDDVLQTSQQVPQTIY